MYWSHGYGIGTWIGMAIIMLLSWSVLVLAIFVVVRSLLANPPQWHRHSQSAESPEPLRLIERRLARGEIDLDDHPLRSQLLSGSAVVGPAARDRPDDD